MNQIIVNTTKHRQIIDLTDQVNQHLTNEATLCHLFVTHTTCALTTADLDPGTDLDMLDAFEKLIPQLDFRHPHDPSHTHDHILSSLIGTSLTLPVNHNQLVLGTWQRVVLVEFYGPRQRSIILNIQ